MHRFMHLKGTNHMIRTNFNYTELQIERLKILSEYTGLTTAELVRRAVDEYLHNEFQRRQADHRTQVDALTEMRSRNEPGSAEIQELVALSEERMRRGSFQSPDIEELAEKARAKVAT